MPAAVGRGRAKYLKSKTSLERVLNQMVHDEYLQERNERNRSGFSYTILVPGRQSHALGARRLHIKFRNRSSRNRGDSGRAAARHETSTAGGDTGVRGTSKQVRNQRSASQSHPSVAAGRHGAATVKPSQAPKNHNAMGEKLLGAKIKQWRTALAKKKKVNAWLILTNETCHEIARVVPQTKSDLRMVKGIGKKKLDTYGDDLIQIVQSFLKRGNTPAQSAEMNSAKRNAKRQKIEHASPRLAAAAAAAMNMALAASPAAAANSSMAVTGGVTDLTGGEDDWSFSDCDDDDFE